MKKIQVDRFLSTDLNSEFHLIKSIEVEDSPFDEGAFGKVYFCVSINDIKPSIHQVIKIFKNDSPGIEANYSTIQKLQKKITEKNYELVASKNTTILNEFPAFLGAPQFSFTGMFEGNIVKGFSSNNLKNLGFDEFNDILYDNTKLYDYQDLPVGKKMTIAYHFVSAFKLLKEWSYIHADLKEKAIFVNSQNATCAIIDFDSGVISDTIGEEATTWGTRGDWIAPEIWTQRQNQNTNGLVRVDLFTDSWGVAIGIHYILTTLHPLFYLSELSPRVIQEYFSSTPQKWPTVNKNAPYFRSEYSENYDNYIKLINHFPPELVNQFSHTINKGFLNPHLRTTYDKWVTILGKSNKKSIFARSLNKIIHIVKGPFGKLYQREKDAIIDINTGRRIGKAPVIRKFQASKNFYDGTNPIILTWEVDNADKILLNDEDVSNVTFIEVTPKIDTTYILKVSNDLDIEGDVSIPIIIEIDKTSPYIHYFKIVPEIAKNGQLVNLSWLVEGAESVEIKDIGIVQGNSVKISPRKDHVYVLKAKSFSGIESIARAGVEVDKTPPIIKKFNVFPIVLMNAEPVQVVWETEGAERVQITGFGDFPPTGKVDLEIRGDTTLAFSAISHYGVSESLLIDVITSKEPPIIHTFDAERYILFDDTPVNLFWDIENAVHIEIDNGVGEVTGLAYRSVHSMTDKVYTLTALSYFGVPAYATLEILIDRTPPKILSFKSDKEFILADYNICLSWEVPEAYQTKLYPGGNIVGKYDYLETTVRQDTIFKLVAANYFGIESYAEVQVRILPIPIIEALLVPTFSFEERIHIDYNRPELSQLPSNIIQFNNSLLIETFKMTEIRVELFTPPLKYEIKSIGDMIRGIYQDHILTAFERIKKIIQEKLR